MELAEIPVLYAVLVIMAWQLGHGVDSKLVPVHVVTTAEFGSTMREGRKTLLK